ncbi:MAG: hypothetical protein R2713_20670 [Ilumatobacteraceae bacterium]
MPAPPPRPDVDGVGRPIDAGCSAFVFKVQANMDKSHRDRRSRSPASAAVTSSAA